MSSGDDRDASGNGGGGDADPFALGNRHAERGEMQEAEAAYRRADEDGHGTAAAYAGVFAEARGDFDEARDAYRRADERGDGFGALRLGLLSAAQRRLGRRQRTHTHARTSAATNHRRSIPQACAPGAGRAMASRRRSPRGARRSRTRS